MADVGLRVNSRSPWLRRLPFAALASCLLMATAACAGQTTTAAPGTTAPTTTAPPAPGPTTDPDTPVSSSPGATEPGATEPGAGDTRLPGGVPPAGAAGTITVTLDPDGDGPEAPLTRTVGCPESGEPEAITETANEPFPWGGPLADAAAACAALADGAVLEALAPPPADQICTEIFGGPATAAITGELLIGGDALAAVERTVTRANGCEIAAWDTLVALVGPPPPFTG